MGFWKKNIFDYIEKNDPEKLEQYIKKNPNSVKLKYKGRGASTAEFAVDRNCTKALQVLVDAGAPLEELRWGRTPLLNALADYRWDCAKILIKGGANVFAVSQYSRSNALHMIANRDSAELMQELIDRGVDVNAQDDNGLTPLHSAGCHSSANARILLKNKADPTIRNNDGLMPHQYGKDDNAKIAIKEALSGRFMQENHHLVSIVEFATACSVDEARLYNFQAETITYQNNKSGESLTRSFDEAVSKAELKAATDFYQQQQDKKPAQQAISATIK